MSDSRPSDKENSLWEPLEQIAKKGVVVAEETLPQLFPENTTHYAVEKLDVRDSERYPGYTMYGRVSKDTTRNSLRVLSAEKVAYGCHACDRIVTGKPQIEDGLPDRRRPFKYEVSCVLDDCKARLY